MSAHSLFVVSLLYDFLEHVRNTYHEVGVFCGVINIGKISQAVVITNVNLEFAKLGTYASANAAIKTINALNVEDVTCNTISEVWTNFCKNAYFFGEEIAITNVYG